MSAASWWKGDRKSGRWPDAAQAGNAHTVSIAIPFFNEAPSVAALVEELHFALRDFPYRWELILVDDGSEDDTLALLEAQARRYGRHVRVIGLSRNFGQTAAMQAGLDAARGTLVVTLDGDGQNDPADIPAMVAELQERELDLLVGWRRERRDATGRTRLSRAANWLIGRVTGVRLHDYGCTLKVYRRAAVREIALHGEMHRFIPALLATVVAPRRIGERDVNHRARRHGASKYGPGRTARVLLDLVSVFFLLRFARRPGHFFGGIGLVLGACGTLLLAWLACVKFLWAEPIGGRPMLLVAALLVMGGLQMLTTGILAEMVLRASDGGFSRRSHAIDPAGEAERHPNDGWMDPRHGG